LETTTLKRLWKNEYVKTAVMIILIITIVFGFWYGIQIVLNTPYPALAVASGSMCTLPGPYCDGWSHPFEHTLHVGDLIIVQGVNPKDIKTGPYPYGDIIVFRKPGSTDELIVHRAIDNATGPDGKIYFRTQGDGNPGPDSHTGEGSWNFMVSQDLVIGKVIMRIPWVGHLALFMHNSSGIFLIAIIIIILLVIEIIIPIFTGKEAETEQVEGVEKAFEA
jgi:signal peptidase I